MSGSAHLGTEEAPPKRKNKTYRHSHKVRVVEAWKSEEDWKSVARNNGVAQPTAYKWVQTYRELELDEELSDEPEIPKKKERVGRQPLLSKSDQEKIPQYIEDNPEITMEQLKAKLAEDLGVQLSTTTVWRYIEGQMISYKKIHYESTTMNNEQNRLKRKEFVTKLLEYESGHKKVIYLDETNYNVFCRRAYGRSKIGERTRSVRPASKGHNLTIVAALSAAGVLHWSYHRGSFRKINFKEWMVDLLNKITHERQWSLDEIVVVIDNAPVHSGIENTPEMEGVCFLRLAPYSAPLNPVEILWSAVKTDLKGLMRARLEEILSGRNGLTLKETRLQILEESAQEAMIKPDLTLVSMRAVNHVKKHYPGVLDMQNLLTGA